MKRISHARLHLVVGSAVISVWTGCTGIDKLVPVVAPTQVCASPREETVACTLDGDTFDVSACGDQGERIRFLGVAAPEIAHDPKPAECWGDEAAAWVDERVTGRQVRLEFDSECTDIYGRTLAWIFITGDHSDPLYDELVDLGGIGILDDGSFDLLFNEFVVRAGQAGVYDENFAQDVLYYDRMVAAAAAAEADGLGMWSGCDK
ncbi:MAG: hypothetical protein GXP62_14560 [Oligoflexia bacterium]|nr:hypothetical protein [Oligoflexia bacterium]